MIALAQPKTASEVELLTGLVAERRAEGIAMIDPTGRLSDVRFPSTGTIAQVALLLAGEIADRVLDVDAPELPKLPIPHVSDDHLIEQLDAAIPEAGIFEDLADEDDEFALPAGEPAEPPEPVTYPKIDDDWLADKVTELVDQFGRTFAAQWQADHNGLRKQALGLLQRLRLTHAVDGGVLVLPVLARYRDVVVSVRERDLTSISRWTTPHRIRSTSSAPDLPQRRTIRGRERMSNARFRPTRAGIINLWDYRDQEFSFADGRLVLRGPNGSGKTKALEVLFPFVFDGRIEPRRLNPFAGEERTMKSNLLYRGQDSAHSYVWMEFCRGSLEDPESVTVGIGMRATRTNDKVTRWYFVADGRVGVDFSLIGNDDRPLTKKQLAEQLGSDSITDRPRLPHRDRRADVRSRCAALRPADQPHSHTSPTPAREEP
ncbi:hypothetical protein GCM10020255_082960 [Rhodococcus baikonurensis]